MNQKLRENGLSITLLGLFFVIQVGFSLVGQRQYNQEQADHGRPTVSYFEYLRSPAFLEATMENWESEFLQMFAYVLLTAFLFQKGSAESKDPEKQESVDATRVNPATTRPLRGQCAKAASFLSFMRTLSRSHCFCYLSYHLCCMRSGAPKSTANSKRCTAKKQLR